MSEGRSPLRLFAVAAPGLEPLVQGELARLGLVSGEAVPRLAEAGLPVEEQRSPGNRPPDEEGGEETGGVEFDADLAGLYRANLWLRTASRVLLRLGDFYAAAFSELRKKASRLPWEDYLRPGQPVVVRATCHRSKLYHSAGVAERVAGAIGDRLGQPTPLVKADPAAPAPPQQVLVRLVHDHAVISLDTSGELLHRRGYRQAMAKAPLRETLAAGLLLASGWDGAAPLLDPFCGSGTIPIEAALIARHIPPGKRRRFAFMDWPGYSPAVWQAMLDQAAAQECAAPGPILASDRDAGAMDMARSNAERAGVADSLAFACQAFSAMTPPPGPGWLVTNPPYGVRVSAGRDLRNLYSQLGNVLLRLAPGWQAGILCSSDYLIGHTYLHLKPGLRLVNGGIPVTFYMGRVPYPPGAGGRNARRG